MNIIIDNVNCNVVFESKAEQEAFASLKKDMQVMAPGAQYTFEYKRWKNSKGKAGWDGKVNLLKQDRFLTGLLPEIQRKLWQKFKITPTLIDKRPAFKLYGFASKINLNPHQEDAWQACVGNRFNNMDWNRGVIELATGGGKTHIAMALFEYYNENTLFLVHRKDLVYQTAERFKEFLGIKPTIAVEGAVIPGHKLITISTVQTLTSFLNQTQELPFLKDVVQVIFDEAHLVAASLAKGNTFVQISERLPNAYIRWGLSATPFMKDSYSNWLLRGVTGDTVYTKKSQDLIKIGHLTPPKITILQAPKVQNLKDKWPGCYDGGIVLNSERNKLIIEKLKTIPKPCIIMCKQISHANIIQNYGRQEGLNIPILQGASSKEEREETVIDLKSGKINAIICTTIFDEGIDIPELRSIILAGAGRSAIKQIQRIGRLLRKSKGKQEVTVIDFNDTSSKLLQKHSKERINICREQGFEVNIS